MRAGGSGVPRQHLGLEFRQRRSRVPQRIVGVQDDSVLCDLMDLSPRGIREHLGLSRPIYARSAAYGHFGRKSVRGGFTWEKTDLAKSLKEAVKAAA